VPQRVAGRTVAVKNRPWWRIRPSRQDVKIQGDWRKLLNEVRDSPWMMAYDNHLKPLAYAARKLGIQWTDLSPS
jgi:hypothetical protein